MTDMMSVGQSGMTGRTPFVRLRACGDYVKANLPILYDRKAG